MDLSASAQGAHFLDPWPSCLTSRSRVQPSRPLTIPIPAAGLRAHTGPIEEALSTVRELDYLLEAGLADDVESAGAVDTELVRALVRTAELQATELLANWLSMF